MATLSRDGIDRVRHKVFHLLEVEAGDRGVERFINVALLALIVLNVIAVVVETVDDIRARFGGVLQGFEWFSVGVFSIEYILRLWSCTANPRFARPVVGRVRYMLSPIALVDLLAILPAYLPWLIPLDLRFARAARLFRLARSLKIARYSQALRTLANVVRGKKEELGITALLGLVLLLFASSTMYYVEHDAQPRVFSSIPAAMWWGVVTLTTVGYGDIYPITGFGKFVAGFIAILGIGLYALPAGIIAAGFADELRKRGAARSKCPHCGGEL